jgi:UDP-N-acetylmuramoyl-L-alanyl-D-glutamate--2,6-diaminopimelate ligase
MQFSKLAADCQRQGPEAEIQGLSRDSRTVQPGFLFAAIPGDKTNGSDFIAEALKKGAVAILAAPGVDVPRSVPAAFHPEPRKILSKMAAMFYPSQPKTIAAVTGTSGKTSTVQFLRQIWQHAGHKAAAIGTLGIIGDGIERYGSLTTPDSISLHRDLKMLNDELGITHVALEASSHGLHQFRLDGVKIGLAAFTNLSRDHLDYHKSMEEYFAAKHRLFNELLPKDGVAVLNRDSDRYTILYPLMRERGIKVISFGTKGADLNLLSAREEQGGQMLQLEVMGKKHKVLLPLSGAFQGWNALCAAALAIGGGETEDTVLSALPTLQGVRGRMEMIGEFAGGRVYVDYAHKPDALENVLKTLRDVTRDKLIVVFGCGGGRDQGKRPIMGEIAKRLADTIIVTDDNPRMESPASIRKEILLGCPEAIEIGDRAEAIAKGLSLLKQGGILVIAGKGHEPGQIVGTETLPFDDADVARRYMHAHSRAA